MDDRIIELHKDGTVRFTQYEFKERFFSSERYVARLPDGIGLAIF